LCLGRGAHVDELDPIPHELAELSDLDRGYPGLGQFADPHAVEQLATIEVVVLHPSALPIEALGVHQMDIGAQFVEDVDGPVPAVRGLDGHLWSLAGFGDDLCQGEWIVVDLRHRKLIAPVVVSHD
jgi:hypothetical protein